MLDDHDAVELVAACLADAAAAACSAEDLMLTATALARDLTDMLPEEQSEVLEAALPLAVTYLDESDLEVRPFAAALGQLYCLRGNSALRAHGSGFATSHDSDQLAA
jgi:hypothetical protein